MEFQWDEWNLDHIAEHGVSPREAEAVVVAAKRPFPTYRGDGKWLAMGRGSGGRLLQVVYVLRPGPMIYVIHARPLTAMKAPLPQKEMNMSSGNGKRKPAIPGDFVTVRGKKMWKPYTEMNTAELGEATAEFDKEFISDTFKPLSPKQRRLWNNVKRGRGRPKVGKGVKVISVSIEKSLLAEFDRLAKKANLSRARLISHGMHAVLERNDLGSSKSTK